MTVAVEFKDITTDTLLEDVEHHFRVLAGPGAGKTSWLVNHIGNVVRRSTRLPPSTRIGCISYTNVAVEEIRTRLGPLVLRVDVSTIHSFLYRNLVKPYLHLLTDKHGEPLVQYARVDGHDEHRPNYQKVKEWLGSINQGRLVSAGFKEQFAELLVHLSNLIWRFEPEKQEWQLLPRTAGWERRTSLKAVFARADASLYKSLYWQEGLIDHEDVLYFAHRLLEEYPTLRGFMSARFPYLFIDEFQDTLPVQTAVVKWLADEGTVVGVIGDPVQAIYQFLGATPLHFTNFSLPQYADYRIHNNWRSTDSIIAFLNYCRGPEFLQVGLRRVVGEPVAVCVGVIDKIVLALREQLGESKTLYVLTRQHTEAKVVRNLDNAGKANVWEELDEIDEDRMRFLEHVIAAGELAEQGLVSLALNRMLRSFRMRKGIPVKPLTGSVLVSEIQRRGAAVALLSFIVTQRNSLKTCSLLEAYQSLSSEIAQHLNGIALQKIQSGKIKAFAESTPYNSLSSTVRLTEENRIIRTIHQAKGAEFENVLVYFSQAAERVRHMLLPLDHEDEEARISFVAFSRARDRLFIAFPKLPSSDQIALQNLGIEVKVFD